MFDCHVDILKGYVLTSTYLSVKHYIREYERTNGDETLTACNFSSDNWESVYQFIVTYYPNTLFKLIPLPKTSNPFDKAYFMYCKGSKWLYPIIWLDVVFAGIKPYKLNTKSLLQGKLVAERDTSGKLKAYFKMKIHEMKWAKKIIDFYIYGSDYYKSWLNIFKIYHGTEHRVFKAFVNEKE